MAPEKKVTAPPPVEGPLPSATLDKYKAAATVVSNTLQALIAKTVEGASVLELSVEGDKLIEQATASLYNKVKGIPKGIAFPTSIAVNSTLQNFSPLPSDATAETKLNANDVVKICLGAHIDGYPVVAAETVIVSSVKEPITGVRATLLQAAHQAAEVAIRLVKPGVKNWEVTEGIKSVLKEYEASGVKGVEGVLSHQHEQNSIEAKKGIVAFPTLSQRSDSENSYTFDEGEVYGLNIIVTNGEKAPKADTARTSVFQKTSSTYLLKMKTSRATFSEISKKAGTFPFTLRSLEEESKARMGVRECVQHGLLKPFEVSTTDKASDLAAQIFLTFTVTKSGAARLSLPPTFYSEERIKSDVEIKNEEVKAILARSLKPKKAKKVEGATENGEKKAE